MQWKRINVLGVPVDCVTMADAVDVVDGLVSAADGLKSAGKPRTIIAVNPEKVIRARNHQALMDSLRAAALLIPDGIGIVWAARILGLGRMRRVPGSELMPALCERAAKRGYRVFLFGASPQTNARAAEALRERYSGLQIVGHQHGYLSQDDMDGLVRRINDCQADILFVALGSPKQEMWMARYLPTLSVKVCQGVGGTFDVVAGHARRAPRVFRTLNLEWLYRLLSQPSRILRQTALPKFVWQVFCEKLRHW